MMAHDSSRYVTLGGLVESVTPVYYVPRSQVWEGSRGRQAGRIHLHANGRALCGRKRGWYEREPMEGDQPPCERCEARAKRLAADLEELVDLAMGM